MRKRKIKSEVKSEIVGDRDQSQINGNSEEIPVTDINKFFTEKLFHIIITHAIHPLICCPVLKGQFLILWQPPMLPMPILKVGITHQGVIWIREQLNMESRSAFFNYALRRRLIAFQAEHNLKADGVIGEQTLLALQALRGEPLLLNQK
jgi:hypothetical protein